MSIGNHQRDLVTEEKIRGALSAVLEPASGKDIVSLGLVTGISISGDSVYCEMTVDPRAGKTLESLRQAAERAVAALPGVAAAAVILTAERKAKAVNGAGAATQINGAGAAPGKLQIKAPPQKQGGGHAISSRPVAPQVRQIIAVAPGKGGVGKSTVAANLALSFAALGKKTGLLDADIYGSSQPRMMGLRKKPEMNAQEMIIPPEAHGVKVMSMGFFVADAAPVIWRGPMVHSAIQQLLRDVDWGALDILVIDLPPGTGDAQLSLAQNVPLAGAVIVSTPQDVALSEAKKAIAMFEKTGVPVLGLVENMSYYVCPACGHRDEIFSHGGARHAAMTADIDFLGEIPLEIAVRENADAGVPLVKAAPFHPVAEAFRNIAARIWMKLPEAAARRSMPS